MFQGHRSCSEATFFLLWVLFGPIHLHYIIKYLLLLFISFPLQRRNEPFSFSVTFQLLFLHFQISMTLILTSVSPNCDLNALFVELLNTLEFCSTPECNNPNLKEILPRMLKGHAELLDKVCEKWAGEVP